MVVDAAAAAALARTRTCTRMLRLEMTRMGNSFVSRCPIGEKSVCVCLEVRKRGCVV